MSTPDHELTRSLRELVQRQLKRPLQKEEEQGLANLLRLIPPQAAPRHDLNTQAQQLIMQALNEGKERVDSTMRQVAESLQQISSEALASQSGDEQLALNWLEAIRSAAQAATAQPTPAQLQQITPLISAEVERQLKLALDPVVRALDTLVGATTPAAAPAANTASTGQISPVPSSQTQG
ncbi:hypothetical protein [Paludibacterium yongneupense]|uniref:hypothetical protein n=1 Tax=Paludibacterium yongneupense TaxID=400061 RepID=UPI000424B9A8|nr:hypothetical protein [Paludibacterium yongneupense]